jgi:hypothetical protein
VSAIDWLLDSDPAISWQAMRDLTDASSSAIDAQRSRVPRDGIGAQILACQGSDGAWHRPDAADWLPTLFTMQLLRATGVERTDAAVQSAITRLETGYRWPAEFGAYSFFGGEVEPCINGGTLALGAYFGHPNESLARRLVSEQLDDGGWNCDAPKSTRSSFHTTICVLEGLLEYERAVGAGPEFVPDLSAARRRGEEYLLKRALFRRLSTGEVANPAFLNFAFPPRYHYDVLRVLDYFSSADLHDSLPISTPNNLQAGVQNELNVKASHKNFQPDPRIAEALRIVINKRQPDGRWLLDASHDESLALSLDESVGQPSRWNTLRALRVLRWAEQRALPATPAP